MGKKSKGKDKKRKLKEKKRAWEYPERLLKEFSGGAPHKRSHLTTRKAGPKIEVMREALEAMDVNVKALKTKKHIIENLETLPEKKKEEYNDKLKEKWKEKREKYVDELREKSSQEELEYKKELMEDELERVKDLKKDLKEKKKEKELEKTEKIKLHALEAEEMNLKEELKDWKKAMRQG